MSSTTQQILTGDSATAPVDAAAPKVCDSADYYDIADEADHIMGEMWMCRVHDCELDSEGVCLKGGRPDPQRPDPKERGQIVFALSRTDQALIVDSTLPPRLAGVSTQALENGVLIHDDVWPGGQAPQPGEVWALRGEGPYLNGSEKHNCGWTLLFLNGVEMVRLYPAPASKPAPVIDESRRILIMSEVILAARALRELAERCRQDAMIIRDVEVRSRAASRAESASDLASAFNKADAVELVGVQS